MLSFCSFRYKVSPSQEVNFGILAVGSKKMIDIYIENKGTFNFKYNIEKYDKNKEKDPLVNICI